MSLAALLHSGALRRLATATFATPATDDTDSPRTVATVATVAGNPTTEADREPPTVAEVATVAVAARLDAAEIDVFSMRVRRFTRAGLQSAGAESVADRLVRRDRESDDRRLCLECARLGRRGPTGWRCGDAQAAAVGNELPRDFVLQPQRCDAFLAFPVASSDTSANVPTQGATPP